MIFTDEELRPFGYAKGGYVIKCQDCGRESWDVDKRGRVCRECAEKRAVAALRARITELTQCDPSWYDMSVADAFRLWKADREELERARGIVADYQRIHAEQTAEIERLKEELRQLEHDYDLQCNCRDAYRQERNNFKADLTTALSALTRCRNEALEEAIKAVQAESAEWDTAGYPLVHGNNKEGAQFACLEIVDKIRALKTSPPKAGEPQPATAPETNED